MRIKRRPLTTEEARERMATLCARSEQAPFDILTKLSRLGIARSAAGEIIDWLEEHDFLNAGRYARAYTNDKVRFSCWGRYKIRAALRAKHIDTTSIDEALEQITPEEYEEALRRALKAAMAGCDPTVNTGRMKIARRLTARGFESSLIFSAIGEIVKKIREDEYYQEDN